VESLNTILHQAEALYYAPGISLMPKTKQTTNNGKFDVWVQVKNFFLGG
jgi:hypothetical protein